MLIQDIQNKLKKRYTSKKFDPSKKINIDNYNAILEAANLAPTSFGIQSFKVIEVTERDLITKISPIAFNQPQILSCEKLLIWAVETDMNKCLKEYKDRIIKSGRQDEAGATGFIQYISGFVDRFQGDQAAINDWSAKQAYISLGFALQTAAMLDVACAPMEGFDRGAFDQLLELDKLGLKSYVMLAIGNEQADDANSTNPKVRKTLEELIVKM
jgi:nitroreductase / dihydropteridine reductase